MKHHVAFVDRFYDFEYMFMYIASMNEVCVNNCFCVC